MTLWEREGSAAARRNEGERSLCRRPPFAVEKIMSLSPNTFHAYWQQRVNKEKRAIASHLAPYLTEQGFRLRTPDLHDAVDTAQEAINGYYRVKSVPGMAAYGKDDAVNGHVLLPRPRLPSASTTAASSFRSRCSECEKKPGPGGAGAALSSHRSGKSSPAGTNRSQQGLTRARSAGGLSSSSQRLLGSALVSNSGKQSPFPGGGSRQPSEHSIAFYNDQQKVVNVPPVRPGPASSQGGSVCGSARLGSSASACSNASLQREVEALVRQEMERMVLPLHEELAKERKNKEIAEAQIKALTAAAKKS